MTVTSSGGPGDARWRETTGAASLRWWARRAAPWRPLRKGLHDSAPARGGQVRVLGPDTAVGQRAAQRPAHEALGGFGGALHGGLPGSRAGGPLGADEHGVGPRRRQRRCSRRRPPVRREPWWLRRTSSCSPSWERLPSPSAARRTTAGPLPGPRAARPVTWSCCRPSALRVAPSRLRRRPGAAPSPSPVLRTRPGPGPTWRTPCGARAGGHAADDQLFEREGEVLRLASSSDGKVTDVRLTLQQR